MATKRLKFGDTVWVDDELRTGIECTIQGFNRDREPILEAVDGPLRFRGSDRHVLDVPWENVKTEKSEPTLLEAAKALIEEMRPYVDCILPFYCHYSPSFLEMRRAVEREEEERNHA